jgi:hypothetical protein
MISFLVAYLLLAVAHISKFTYAAATCVTPDEVRPLLLLTVSQDIGVQYVYAFNERSIML